VPVSGEKDAPDAEPDDTGGASAFSLIQFCRAMLVLLPLVFLLAWWGRKLGLTLGSPWLLAGLTALIGFTGTEWWQRLVGGGALHNRLALRLLIAMGLVAGLVGPVGWGFMLPCFATLIGVVHIGWSGAASWRTTASAVVVATIATQCALQLGVIESIMPVGLSHLLAAWNLLLAIMGLSNLGGSAAQVEGANEELRRTEARFRALIEKSSDVITVMDADSRLVDVSPAMLHVAGWESAGLVGTDRIGLVHPDDQSRMREAVQDLVRSGDGQETRFEFRSRHFDGTWRWHETTMRNLLADPDVRGIVCHERDISERRLHQEKLARIAAHDGLTGLPNRPEVLRLLDDAVAAVPAGRSLAVLFIDLDGFKGVNDTYGHRMGDELLIAAAGRLRQELLPTDVLSRFGGDEFVAVVRDAADVRAVQSLAERLMAVMREPFDLSGGTVRIGASIGTAAIQDTDTDRDAKALIDYADAQMYLIKRGNAPNAGRVSVLTASTEPT
jgi:diguanylate cyclase (GGDEF)-like protein/PAS domain S-box-containing protein